MAWPTHHAHEKVQSWLAFPMRAKGGPHASRPKRSLFASCRILHSPLTHSPPQMLSCCSEANPTHPSQRFWAGEISLAQALKSLLPRLRGHSQRMPIYMGLAIQRRGKLVAMVVTSAGCSPRRARKLISWFFDECDIFWLCRHAHAGVSFTILSGSFLRHSVAHPLQ